MATFYFDGDKLQECPYNPNHRVLQSRLLSHITKCAEDPSSPKLQECPFNRLHRIQPEEFAEHVVECVDNAQTMREMFNPSAPVSQDSSEPQSQGRDDQNNQDTWESDENRGKAYVIPGCGDEEEGEQEQDSDRFICQQKLYKMKPAERKRLYSQLTEDTLKRKFQQEREELTEEEARELGIDIKPKFNFMIDPKGEPSTSGSGVNQDEEEATIPKRIRISDEPKRDPWRQRQADVGDTEDEDKKELVLTLLTKNEQGCFKIRKFERDQR